MDANTAEAIFKAAHNLKMAALNKDDKTCLQIGDTIAGLMEDLSETEQEDPPRKNKGKK